MSLKKVGFIVMVSMAAAVALATLDTITNNTVGGFGTWRTNINECILLTNTNTANIAATSNAFVSADSALSNALSTLYIAADTTVSNALAGMVTAASNAVTTGYTVSYASLSNAFVVADSTLAATNSLAITTLSNALAAAYAAADTVVSNGVYTAATNAMVSAYASADTIVSNAFVSADSSIVSAYGSADTVVSNAFVSADSSIVSAYGSADTVVSNAFVAADTALSNHFAEVSGVTASTVTNISAYVVSQSNQYVAADTVVSNAFVSADTVVSNALVSAYGSADTALSNALSGASSVFVSPYGLLSAWTFDAALTEDWWGTNTLADSDGLAQAFDSTLGGYVDNTNSTDNPLNATFPFGNEFAYVFCARMADASGNYVFWHTNPSFHGAYASRDNNNNLWSFTYNDGTSTDTLSYNDGETSTSWHHFAFVYDSGELEVYLYHNGALADESTGATLEPMAWTNAMIIGHNAATDTKDVDFAYFYLFNRALSSNEVGRIYQLENAGQYGIQGLRRP